MEDPQLYIGYKWLTNWDAYPNTIYQVYVRLKFQGIHPQLWGFAPATRDRWAIDSQFAKITTSIAFFDRQMVICSVKCKQKYFHGDPFNGSGGMTMKSLMR